MRRDEAGQVTAFVVVFAMALILVGGLVVDGGVILAANRRAGAEAEAAARAGVQALDTDAYRRGEPARLDAAEAVSLAEAWVSRYGHAGTARVLGPDTVEVQVSFTQPLAILGIIGLGPVDIDGTGRARLVVGTGEDVR